MCRPSSVEADWKMNYFNTVIDYDYYYKAYISLMLMDPFFVINISSIICAVMGNLAIEMTHSINVAFPHAKRNKSCLLCNYLSYKTKLRLVSLI